MYALLFEVEPHAGHEEHYFARAAKLRPLLANHTGLTFLERFKSLSRPNIILSHSHWRDEDALAKWRTDATHYRSQVAGRNRHFRDYRIRISHVLQMHSDGEETTYSGSLSITGEPRLVVVVATRGRVFDADPNTSEGFASVATEGAFLSVCNVNSEAEGKKLMAAAQNESGLVFALLTAVKRDYGMHEREEAPQIAPRV